LFKLTFFKLIVLSPLTETFFDAKKSLSGLLEQKSPPPLDRAELLWMTELEMTASAASIKTPPPLLAKLRLMVTFDDTKDARNDTSIAPPWPFDEALFDKNKQPWTDTLQLACEMYNAPPPANAVVLPESIKLSENVELKIVATEDSTDKAPPLVDASNACDETELFKKVQSLIANRIWGGLSVKLIFGSSCLSQIDARYEVPAATAPPLAEQPLPEQTAVPKEKEDDSTVTKLL
jgi:hypothetical protein